jgi:hypothetical protein
VSVRFGSFNVGPSNQPFLNSGVFSNGGSTRADCWLFHAAGVELEGDGRTTHELRTFMPDGSRPVPARIDLTWFRKVAPIGLQVPKRAVKASPLVLGFVAGMLEEKAAGGTVEVAYPFLVRSADDRILLEFSALGPAPEIQRQIGVAFSERLLWEI